MDHVTIRLHDEDFWRAYRAAAAGRGLTTGEFLQHIFAEWRRAEAADQARRDAAWQQGQHEPPLPL